MDDQTKSQPKQQSKRAAVVVGRFNPPTIGHYAVFDAVKKYIRSNPELRLDAVPIVVIVEGKNTSKDKHKNPLTGHERQSFMEGSGRANGCKFLISPTAYDAFEDVREAGYEPIAVAAGSDRADTYIGMLDKYFKTPDDKDIDHYVIELPRDADSTQFGGLEDENKHAALDDILQYMDDDLPINMVSGSLARHAVSRDALDKFAVITGLEGKPKLADLMFKKIKAAQDSMKEEPDGAA